MILYSGKNKPYIKLTEDKLIFFNGILKKSFSRKKIHSIKITEDFKVSILYGKQVYSINLDKINIKDFNEIKKIFNELNKEKIIFYAEDNRNKRILYLVICIIFWTLSFYSTFIAIEFPYIVFMMGLGYFIGYVYLKCSLQGSYKLLYETNSNFFRIVYGINKKIEIPLSNNDYKIKYDRENHKYLLTKSEKEIISFYNGIVYPLYYKDHLNKMMKVKLDIN